MLNEFAYCPRLPCLIWLQGEWAESADTVDEKVQHRRMNRAASLTLGWCSYFGLGLFVSEEECE